MMTLCTHRRCPALENACKPLSLACPMPSTPNLSMLHLSSHALTLLRMTAVLLMLAPMKETTVK